MKASELVEDIKRLIAEHGDLECVNDSNDSVLVTWNDDMEDEDPVFLFE